MFDGSDRYNKTEAIPTHAKVNALSHCRLCGGPSIRFILIIFCGCASRKHCFDSERVLAYGLGLVGLWRYIVGLVPQERLSCILEELGILGITSLASHSLDFRFVFPF